MRGLWNAHLVRCRCNLLGEEVVLRLPPPLTCVVRCSLLSEEARPLFPCPLVSTCAIAGLSQRDIA